MSAEAMEYLRNLVDNSVLAIALTDEDGKLVVFNRGAEKLTGYRRHEVLGKPGSLLYWDRRVVADIVRAVENDDTVREQEVLLRTRDGAAKPVALLVTRLYDNKKQVIGNLGIAVDLTERKALQKKMEKATARARLFNDLLCQNVRRYALRIVDRLDELAGLSSLTERQSKVIALCRRQAGRMEVLAEQVHNLTGIETQSEVILKPIPIGDLVTSAVQGVLDSQGHRKVTVDISLPGDCRVLVCDLFTQVVHNLINNAVVHNTKENPHVWIRGEQFDKNGEQWCRLFVEDDGPGVPDEFKEAVFDRFVKLRKSGSGVGLSVVRFLVERCGGKVGIEDRVAGDHSRGAKVTLELHAIGPSVYPEGGRRGQASGRAKGPGENR